MAKLSDTLHNALLAVREIGITHPNSGSVVKALMEILKRDDRLWSTYLEPTSIIVLLASIMGMSPRTYPVGMALVSRFYNAGYLHGSYDEKMERVLMKLLNRDKNSLLWAWAHRIVMAKSAAANVCPMLYPLTG